MVFGLLCIKTESRQVDIALLLFYGIIWLDFTVYRLSSTVAATTTNVQNVSISLVSLYHQDYTTGDISSVDISSFNISSCGTAVVSSGSSEDFDKCGYALSETLLNIIGNSTSTCRSAIQSVSYKVIHDASAAASISSIEASVTLVDIPYSTSSGKHDNDLLVCHDHLYSEYMSILSVPWFFRLHLNNVMGCNNRRESVSTIISSYFYLGICIVDIRSKWKYCK